MQLLKRVVAILSGNAIVITKQAGNRADVSIGAKVDKKFALSSMAGAVEHLML